MYFVYVYESRTMKPNEIVLIRGRGWKRMIKEVNLIKIHCKHISKFHNESPYKTNMYLNKWMNEKTIPVIMKKWPWESLTSWVEIKYVSIWKRRDFEMGVLSAFYQDNENAREVNKMTHVKVCRYESNDFLNIIKRLSSIKSLQMLNVVHCKNCRNAY
jgi:hypothetical protein